jgi:hypothetical protein
VTTGRRVSNRGPEAARLWSKRSAMRTGYAPRHDGSGSGHCTEQHNVVGPPPLKTPPFPSAYPNPLAPNTKMQGALNAAIAQTPSPPGWNAPICIAALDPPAGPFPAAFKGDDVKYGASMMKLAAVYTTSSQSGLWLAGDYQDNPQGKYPISEFPRRMMAPRTTVQPRRLRRSCNWSSCSGSCGRSSWSIVVALRRCWPDSRRAWRRGRPS